MQLHIVGSGALPPALAQELAGPGGEGLVFHGYLPDDLLALLYSSVRVSGGRGSGGWRGQGKDTRGKVGLLCCAPKSVLDATGQS